MKIEQNAIKDYWDRRARTFGAGSSGLKAVCSYGVPMIYNSYVNIIQKKAISSALDMKGGEKVMDIGCGIGRWSLWLARNGANVTGIDISEDMVGIAREKAQKDGIPIRFIVSSVSDLMVEDASFDMVMAITVFQHITSDTEVEVGIERIKRMLKPGGTFLLLEVAPAKEINRYNSKIFKTRTYNFYKTVCKAKGLSILDERAVDPSPFKRWLVPYYKNLPPLLGWMLVTLAAALSFPVDFIFAGSRLLIPFSWHKIMLFKKI